MASSRLLPITWSPGMKHCLAITVLLVINIISMILSGVFISADDPSWQLDPFTAYGTVPTLLLYLVRLLTFTTLPLTIGNFLGVVSFNLFPRAPTLKGSPILAPFICFRVVTRGHFPTMVIENVKKNLETCRKVGLENFIIEVVTDHTINLPNLSRSREVVVPKSYQTKRGTLYKARALHYSLEDGVNLLNHQDWIVHLDEETLLTESCVIGIFNFVSEGNHAFGQGVITYAHGDVINWVTTLSDSVRVGIDYGAIRYALKSLHKPVFNWKGSFIVANAGAEKTIGLDNGPEGSLAEDCYFGMVAVHHGYTFGFVEGEMHEKSTFTFMDFMAQRKRWMQGISLAFWYCNVPLHKKLGIMFILMAMYTMPFTTLSIPLVILYPLPMYRIFNITYGFLGATFVFLFMFGTMKSLNIHRTGKIKYFVLCILGMLVIPITVVLESSAIVWGMTTTYKTGFHIVEKQKEPKRLLELV